MSNDSVSTNLEVLRMAREMVNTEYFEIKAQLHNQWLVEADLLWRTSRKRLVYPPFPPFPTEDVIVARANVLLAFLSKVDAPAVPYPEIMKVPSTEEPTNVEITTISILDLEPELSYNQPNTNREGLEVEPANNTIEQEVGATKDAAPENTIKRLPSLLKRLMGS